MNFYLLYSGDKAILNKEINDLKIKLKIEDNDVIYYDIEDVDGIIQEALTISMFSLNKMIIIDGTSYFSDKKGVSNVNVIEDYFDNYNPNSYLIFISNSDSIDSRKKLVKLISSKGSVKNLEITDKYLSDYVISYLKDAGYKINFSDVKYFLNKSGTNIDNIKNELDKLMLYKIDTKMILKDDIDLLVMEQFDDSIYDLVNAILKNDNKKAIKLYNNFKNNGLDASQMLPIIASQIRLLFQVKRLYNSGKSNEDIAKILEFKNVYRVKYLLSDSYYYSEEDLIRYLSKLADLDRGIKLGTCDGDVFLELFIIKKDM